MRLGYKARALQNLNKKGLPVYPWMTVTPFTVTSILACYAKEWSYRWAVRTDAPENTGQLLPLLGSNLKTSVEGLGEMLLDIQKKNPECSFILSEAPDDSIRDSNIVCWKDGDYLFGEINFQSLTLRDAWVKGSLWPFVITGGPGDVLRNNKFILTTRAESKEFIGQSLNLAAYRFRLDYLRMIRELIIDEGYEYEISVMNDGRIIFWQESPFTENRDTLLRECLL
jgi:hypothetical protein